MSDRHLQPDLLPRVSLDPLTSLKQEMRLALKRSRLSRDEVAAAMKKELAEQGINATVTRNTVDNWCKDSDPSRVIPLRYLPAFCKVVETLRPAAALVWPLGAAVVGPEDAALLDAARARVRRLEATREERHAMAAYDLLRRT